VVKKLLVVVLLLVAVLAGVNLTVARLPQMPAAGGSFISLRDKDIHYIEQSGTGPLVVLIHGLPGTAEDFTSVMARLPGRHVIALDRPGFGWSKGGWLPFQDQVDVVHELIGRFGGGPAVVVGHSYGGSVALAVAARHPDDVGQLVLVAPAGGGMRAETKSTVEARYLKATQLPVVGDIIAAVFANLLLRISADTGLRNAFHPAPVQDEYRRRLLSVSMSPGNLAALADDRLEFNSAMEWLDAHVGDVRAPTSVVAADQDQLVPLANIRALVGALPHGAELTVLDGGHMIVETHPDVIADRIRSAITSRS